MKAQGQAQLLFDFECNLWVAWQLDSAPNGYSQWITGYGDTPQEAVEQLRTRIERERE